MNKIAICIASLLLQPIVTSGGTALGGDAKMIDVNKAWVGMLPIESVLLLPKVTRDHRIGIIDKEEIWSKIWKAHQPDEKQPKVDFDSQVVVFIKNVRHLNRITLVSAELDDGLLTIRSKQTRSARPIRGRVHCVLIIVQRVGIRQISDGRTKIVIE
jgi:hypothetical protein